MVKTPSFHRGRGVRVSLGVGGGVVRESKIPLAASCGKQQQNPTDFAYLRKLPPCIQHAGKSAASGGLPDTPPEDSLRLRLSATVPYE